MNAFSLSADRNTGSRTTAVEEEETKSLRTVTPGGHFYFRSNLFRLPDLTFASPNRDWRSGNWSM